MTDRRESRSGQAEPPRTAAEPGATAFAALTLGALVQGLSVKRRAAQTALVLLGIFGVALFFGDGTITPAISVISSVEGLQTAAPGLKSFVLPITVALITVLFAGQQFGTRAIVDHPFIGFLALGAIVLVVTGAEALYADLGQFSRRSITLAWVFVVFPALILNYLGQGALIIFTVLSTWQRGRVLVTEKRSEAEGRLRDFVEQVRHMDPPLQRVPGTAVFLPAGKETSPLALRANVDYNHVVHESVVIVSVETEPVPHVDHSERVAVDDLGYTDDGIIHLTLRYGFQDDQSVPAALRQAGAQDLTVKLDAENATYFVSEITIVLGDDRRMRRWRKRLFLLLSRTSKSPVGFFGLPDRRIVTMGSYLDL